MSLCNPAPIPPQTLLQFVLKGFGDNGANTLLRAQSRRIPLIGMNLYRLSCISIQNLNDQSRGTIFAIDISQRSGENFDREGTQLDILEENAWHISFTASLKCKACGRSCQHRIARFERCSRDGRKRNNNSERSWIRTNEAFLRGFKRPVLLPD